MGFARGKNVKGIAQGKFSGSTASSCALNYKHRGVHLGTLGSCQPDKHHSRTCWRGLVPRSTRRDSFCILAHKMGIC